MRKRGMGSLIASLATPRDGPAIGLEDFDKTFAEDVGPGINAMKFSVYCVWNTLAVTLLR